MEEFMQADKLANALAGAVTALIIAGGLLRGWLKGGKSASPNGGEVVEIAGALVSDHHARKIVDALDRNTAAAIRCADGVEDATHEIRRLTDETIRGQRRD